MKKSLILIILGIFLISLVSAQVSYCCEKTTYNAWCQNDDEENCNTSFQISPTFCESTSYCRQGCCYNSQEGTCSKNTPERICKEGNGVWSSISNCDIPQCELGCCLIGDQVAFVTQTRCKRLANIYGIPISFRTDINSEIGCISNARSKVIGACVFEKDFERTCEILTLKKCNDRETEGIETEFYEGKLCSNEDLNTICGPSQKTTCVEGRDQVYYLDTCGNLANIYDADRYEDKLYWGEIINSRNSCGYGLSNADSAKCGNCDYFLGSTCKKYESGRDTNPQIGDYVCRNLGCISGVLAEDFEDEKGRFPNHGETWCVESSIEELKEENVPGSRYFRLVCYNSEVLIEPCADYRQEVCIGDEINLVGGGTFNYGSCVANRWTNCFSQDNEKDCNNTDERDCKWMITIGETGACLPKYSPGFDENVDESTCSDIGNFMCIVEYERGVGGSPGALGKLNIWKKTEWEEEKNENCDPFNPGFARWKTLRNNICTSIGDCGISDNYQGEEGFYDEADILWYSGRLDKEELEEVLSQLTQNE